MKPIWLSFLQMFRQLKHDVMLIVITLIPFIAGTVFRFLIPAAEYLLTDYFKLETILLPYYALFDLFLIILTPSMLNYAAAMVILEESDDHMTTYLSVTPLGKAGYLFSRLGIMGLISFPASLFTALLFHLSNTGIWMLAGISFASSLQGTVVALLIVSLSSNKVEGLAMGKISSFLSLGAFAPYFISGNVKYFLSVFPSFWMAEAMLSGKFFVLLLSILTVLFWMMILSGKFIKKVGS